MNMIKAAPGVQVLHQQAEMIAKAGRTARTQSEYLAACDSAIRFVQSPELRAALAAAEQRDAGGVGAGAAGADAAQGAGGEG